MFNWSLLHPGLLTTQIYNLALMINEDCRTKDAMDYLVKEFREIDDQHKDNTDHWLEKLFNS